MKEEMKTEEEFNDVLVALGNAGAFEGRHDETIGILISHAAANHAQREYCCIMPDGRYSSMGLSFKLIPSAGTVGIHVVEN